MIEEKEIDVRSSDASLIFIQGMSTRKRVEEILRWSEYFDTNETTGGRDRHAFPTRRGKRIMSTSLIRSLLALREKEADSEAATSNRGGRTKGIVTTERRFEMTVIRTDKATLPSAIRVRITPEVKVVGMQLCLGVWSERERRGRERREGRGRERVRVRVKKE